MDEQEFERRRKEATCHKCHMTAVRDSWSDMFVCKSCRFQLRESLGKAQGSKKTEEE